MIDELIREAKRTTWKEYVQGLDLSHWGWSNTYPWSDREVLFLYDKLLILYPVYAEDILDDVNVSYEFTMDGIAVSWDNFEKDCTVLIDTPENPIGYLLLEEVDEGRWKLVANRVFIEPQELKDFLQGQIKNLGRWINMLYSESIRSTMSRFLLEHGEAIWYSWFKYPDGARWIVKWQGRYFSIIHDGTGNEFYHSHEPQEISEEEAKSILSSYPEAWKEAMEKWGWEPLDEYIAKTL